MWSGGGAYASIHKVHGQILSLIGGGGKIHTWVLQGKDDGLGDEFGQVRKWRIPKKLLKGHGLWGLLRRLERARLLRAMQKLEAKVVLLDGLGVARLLLPVLRKLPGVRVLVVFHGKVRLRKADVGLLKCLPEERLQLIGVSATLAESLNKELARPVMALRTAIDPQEFQRALFEREQARNLLGFTRQDCILLGAVGRLVPEKGYSGLLDAMVAMVGKGCPLHLLIAGEGEQRQVLEEKIQQYGLAAHVTLAGHRADVARLYRAFDLMLIPSRSEGLGLVLQEAVMAGVPVVSSNLPVFVEQLGEAGVYVESGDVGGWVASIEQSLAGDKAALAARQYRQLAPEQAWDEFCRGYRELLAGMPASAS
ncbi:D-inositol 3-phosphate glycosyltransferase [compost metagenome]